MTLMHTTWHHIRRSPFQSIIATFLMVISFFILSLFAIISTGLSSVLNYFETKPEITIFLKDGLDKSAVNDIQTELSNFPSIREIKFISKEKALTIYKEQNKNNPMLTEMVTASILPASFEITVSDPKVFEQIAQKFSTRTDVVDEIIYQKDVIQSLLNWTNIIRKTGIITILIIGFITFMTIFTIIGMKITNRKDEIRISRLLGASKFYVKKPFLLEGIFYGLTGSIIGFFICFLLSLNFRTTLNTFFNPIIFIRTDFVFYFYILLTEMLFGITLGLLASWVGVKRYIKF